jgi:hypothetical protein
MERIADPRHASDDDPLDRAACEGGSNRLGILNRRGRQSSFKPADRR